MTAPAESTWIEAPGGYALTIEGGANQARNAAGDHVTLGIVGLDGETIPIREVGPVAYSEGVRMASHIHAGGAAEADHDER